MIGKQGLYLYMQETVFKRHGTMTPMSCTSHSTCIKTGDSTPEVMMVTGTNVALVLALDGKLRALVIEVC